MRKMTVSASLVALAFVMATFARGEADREQERPPEAAKPERAEEAPIGRISVEVTGELGNVLVTAGEVAGGLAVRLEGERLSHATVFAGGSELLLDVSRSEAAREELRRWAEPQHGDLAHVPVAHVTGHLVFRAAAPPPEVQGNDAPGNDRWSVPTLGIATLENLKRPPRPVVVVDSLTIELGHRSKLRHFPEK